MENKYFGVIEGFYHRPYTFSERGDLIKFLAHLNLNTYVYAPKSDPYHRKEYHKLYPAKKVEEFKNLNNLAQISGVYFNYALSPGVKPDMKSIIKKISQMIETGIKHYSLLYDDIKITLNSENARIQTETANELYEFLKKKVGNPILFFCPTQYCGFEESDYLKKIAENLNLEIKIFWTGPKVVSRRITEKDIDRISKIIKRKPLIWDNLFANDYIPGVIWKFPYRGREPEIIGNVCGILINPMNQYKMSKPLIFTAARFFLKPCNYIPKDTWREAKNIIFKIGDRLTFPPF
uniref:GH84 domain-containing protein n=1 Tax=candidate division WOR-3 bacterium TaxID=2052148 RepID=A0A7C4XK65_UNCW3